MHLKIENKNEIKIKFNNNIYTGIMQFSTSVNLVLMVPCQ